jgi:HEAT repeat protein
VAKSDPIKRKLDQLAALRPSATASGLQPFLRDKSNLVIAKAASIAGERRIDELAPALVAAFERLMSAPARLDPRCAASTAIVKALLEMEHPEPQVYLAGIRHVQMEPSFGQPVDAAVELRAASALGLALTRHDAVLFELVRLLADPEWKARFAAARALACAGRIESIPVLQYKATIGDGEPEVTGECLAGLLTLAPERYVPFAESFFGHPDPAVAEAAILAFGVSRHELAFQTLARRWPSLPAPLREPALSALAMMRSDSARDFLTRLRDDPTLAPQIDRLLSLYRPSVTRS